MTFPRITDLFKPEDPTTTLYYNDVVSFAFAASKLISGRVWGFRQTSDGRLGVRVRVENDSAWSIRDYLIDSREIMRVERGGFVVMDAAQAA